MYLCKVLDNSLWQKTKKHWWTGIVILHVVSITSSWNIFLKMYIKEYLAKMIVCKSHIRQLYYVFNSINDQIQDFLGHFLGNSSVRAVITWYLTHVNMCCISGGEILRITCDGKHFTRFCVTCLTCVVRTGGLLRTSDSSGVTCGLQLLMSSSTSRQHYQRTCCCLLYLFICVLAHISRTGMPHLTKLPLRIVWSC